MGLRMPARIAARLSKFAEFRRHKLQAFAEFRKNKTPTFAEFMKSNLIAAEDEPYVSDLNAAHMGGVRPRSRLMLWIAAAFLAISLIWSYFAKLDEITRATGRVIPSSQIQVVQNLEGGILAELKVEEGDLVEKNQPIIRIDDIRFASSFKEDQQKMLEKAAKIARLTAEVNGTELSFPKEVMDESPEVAESERNLFESRRKELNANLAILTDQLTQKTQELAEMDGKRLHLDTSAAMLQKELLLSTPLVKSGAMSEVELLRIQRQANDLQGELKAAELAIPRITAAIAEAQSKVSELTTRYRSDAHKDLSEATGEHSRLIQTISASQDRVARTNVVSPVRGTVKQIKIRTIGGVIKPGEDLIEIVPIEDNLLIEARVRPTDIAFLHPGQECVVKLTAYDFSIYGGLKGKLEHISADTITPEDKDTPPQERGKSFFLIRVRTDRNYLEHNGKRLNIIPGMTADADILTGKKSVLEYLMKPLIKATARAMHER
jgi:adhesin transport system membrane fusion protein